MGMTSSFHWHRMRFRSLLLMYLRKKRLRGFNSGDLVLKKTNFIDCISLKILKTFITFSLIFRVKTEVNGETSHGRVPLPLQRISTTRLPSISERSHRTLSELSTDFEEPDEPLPPCKSILFYTS